MRQRKTDQRPFAWRNRTSDVFVKATSHSCEAAPNRNKTAPKKIGGQQNQVGGVISFWDPTLVVKLGDRNGDVQLLLDWPFRW